MAGMHRGIFFLHNRGGKPVMKK